MNYIDVQLGMCCRYRHQSGRRLRFHDLALAVLLFSQ